MMMITAAKAGIVMCGFRRAGTRTFCKKQTKTKDTPAYPRFHRRRHRRHLHLHLHHRVQLRVSHGTFQIPRQNRRSCSLPRACSVSVRIRVRTPGQKRSIADSLATHAIRAHTPNEIYTQRTLSERADGTVLNAGVGAGCLATVHGNLVEEAMEVFAIVVHHDKRVSPWYPATS